MYKTKILQVYNDLKSYIYTFNKW